MHANQFTLEQAAQFTSANTPRGWLRLDANLVRGEQHLYLQQPAYGTSYLIGKIQIEALLAARRRQLGDGFTMRRFMDEFDAAGLIPASLLHWELTGQLPDDIGGMLIIRYSLLAAENDREARLGIPDDDDLRIRAARQLFGRFDPLPFEQLRADALRHDPLEVGDALGLDALALGLLLFLLQHEFHLLRLLLAPQLLLDGVGHDGWQPDLPQQHLLDDDAALAGDAPEQRKNLVGDLLSFGGIQRFRFVRGGDLANGRSELGSTIVPT